MSKTTTENLGSAFYLLGRMQQIRSGARNSLESDYPHFFDGVRKFMKEFAQNIPEMVIPDDAKADFYIAMHHLTLLEDNEGDVGEHIQIMKKKLETLLRFFQIHMS